MLPYMQAPLINPCQLQAVLQYRPGGLIPLQTILHHLPVQIITFSGMTARLRMAYIISRSIKRMGSLSLLPAAVHSPSGTTFPFSMARSPTEGGLFMWPAMLSIAEHT